jgi:F-type H+-transporting ATPase subunit delta
MAGELTTVARPYAEAIFAHADEAGKLDLWSEMLAFLSSVVADPRLQGAIKDPNFGRERLEALMLAIGGGRLSAEGQNLVRLLVANDRLMVLPEIAALYEVRKNERQGRLDVHITTAYALQAAQKSALADALKRRLGREVTIAADKDPELIGGVCIRVGDLVIDGSVRNQLRHLASEFGI